MRVWQISPSIRRCTYTQHPTRDKTDHQLAYIPDLAEKKDGELKKNSACGGCCYTRTKEQSVYLFYFETMAADPSTFPKKCLTCHHQTTAQR